MGYDIYMRWPEQTQPERDAQFTGQSLVHGHVGYLRESIHDRDNHATKVLVPEAWDDAAYRPVLDSDYWSSHDEEPAFYGVPIAAARLRERLPGTFYTIERRYAGDPELIASVKASFASFVELAERKEREHGEPVRIHLVP